MKYVSTRGGGQPVSLPEAIVTGLTPDGGLFFPEEIPTISTAERKAFAKLSYAQLTAIILARFSDDFSTDELLAISSAAYAPDNFAESAVAPVRKLDENLFLLELFHGPTGAFKDFALQFLPRIMSLAARKLQSDKICILVATSGDTGGAALAGFADVENMHLLTFFPRNGVSPLQQAQMQCARGDNVAAIEIEGDFDGAQRSVKEIFLDQEYGKQLQTELGIRLSSANSINIGRLLPQICYVFSAHAQMVAAGEIALDEPLDVVVPSGNLGDIFAAYIAKQMGLPIAKLLVANNANDSSATFLNTGTFDVTQRKTAKTLSPAMDILRASNLERLLYFAAGQDGGKLRLWQQTLASDGVFQIDANTLSRIQADFEGQSVTDDETRQTIAEAFAEYEFVLDPHTAVGLAALRKSDVLQKSGNKKLLFSTAHYAKFGKTVFAALFPEREIPDDETAVLSAIAEVAPTPQIPQHFFDILGAEVIHTHTCAATTEDMKTTIRHLLQK